MIELAYLKGMNVAMEMSAGINKSTTRTNIKHNNRAMNEKDKAKNTHIDYTKSDENKYLVKKDIRELYREEFDGPLEKYNAKQKRKDRKIDDYYKHIKNGKKTAPQQEMIIQIGNRDDFEDNEENKEKANYVLEKWFEGFQERNPQLKAYNAVIHNDEASPHLHLNFVPVAYGYKNGLEKQVAFDRALLNQNPNLDKNKPFANWVEGELSEIEKLMNEVGIERKRVGTNDYKDVNEYKEKQDEKAKLEQLTEEVEQQKRKYERKVESYKEPLTELENLESTVTDHKSLFGKKSGKLVPEETYEMLKMGYVKGVVKEEDSEKVAEYDSLERDLELTEKMLEASREKTKEEQRKKVAEKKRHEEEMEQEKKRHEAELKKSAAEYERKLAELATKNSDLQQENSKLRKLLGNERNDSKAIRERLAVVEANYSKNVAERKQNEIQAFRGAYNTKNAIGYVLKHSNTLQPWERDVLQAVSKSAVTSVDHYRRHVSGDIDLGHIERLSHGTGAVRHVPKDVKGYMQNVKMLDSVKQRGVANKSANTGRGM